MDALLKPFIEPVLSCLDVPRHVGCLFDSRKRVDDMNNSMRHLNPKKTDVEAALNDAKRNNQRPTDEVNLWLKEVAELVAKVSAVNEEYEQIRRRHALKNFILLNTWPSIYSCGRRAVHLKAEAAELERQRAGFTALTTPMSIEQNLQTVRSYLQDDKVGVIGIWGPGGVGKTTLLRRINDSLKGDGNLGFDYVIWIEASKDAQLEKLQEDIAERLNLSSPSLIFDFPSLIFDFLKDQNFLLLLDDLWGDIDLSEVGIPQPLYNNGQNQRKQKLVLTTRDEAVCTRMKAHNAIIKVGCLEPEEALQLFREAVGEAIDDSDPEIEALKAEVAKECGGLPLALVIIGKAMSNKKKVHQWKDTLRIMRSHTGKIEGMDVLFPRLKISYDNLADETERQCFLLCSLWPEDYHFEDEELIWCWLGHGRIDLEEFENLGEALDHGRAIIDKLKEACLLEPGPEWRRHSIKMHDIMRDLALWVVGGNKWIAGTVEWKEANQAVVKWKDKEKAYLKIALPAYGSVRLQLPNCPNLSTLILSCGPIFLLPLLDYENNRMGTDFLGSLRVLTYLDLDMRAIHGELPAVIGCLSRLEYLKFQCPKISRLPDELANLSELKYLIVSQLFRDRVQIPFMVILKLQKLLVLHVHNGVLEEDPTEDYDVKDFYAALRRMKSVSVQEIKISSVGALELLSHVEAPRLVICHLESDGQKTNRLRVSSVNGLQQIKHLTITDCSALEKLVMDSSLKVLDSLLLDELPVLREITWRRRSPRVRLRRLKNLTITNCHELKDVSWVLQLPRLRDLHLADCDRMEYVIANTEKADVASVSLETLRLQGLPRLRGICDRTIDFPSLREVTVSNCPELKSLPFKVPHADNKNLIIKGTQKWWDGLIFDDKHTKSALRRHFWACDLTSNSDDGEISNFNTEEESAEEVVE